MEPLQRKVMYKSLSKNPTKNSTYVPISLYVTIHVNAPQSSILKLLTE